MTYRTQENPYAQAVAAARQAVEIRDAARELGCTVRCDPGQHFPEVSPHSPVFLEIVGDRETLVTWG